MIWSDFGAGVYFTMSPQATCLGRRLGACSRGPYAASHVPRDMLESPKHFFVDILPRWGIYTSLFRHVMLPIDLRNSCQGYKGLSGRLFYSGNVQACRTPDDLDHVVSLPSSLQRFPYCQLESEMKCCPLKVSAEYINLSGTEGKSYDQPYVQNAGCVT